MVLGLVTPVTPVVIKLQNYQAHRQPSEISRADRNFKTRLSCGTNAMVVQKAAM
jgi:hypothetical protein